jgi:hypothetical protein
LPYVVQFNVLSGALIYFMEILDGIELHLAPGTVGDLILLEREFGYNGLIVSLARQRDVPRREENTRDLLQEVNKDIRGSTFKEDLRSLRDSFAMMQCDLSVITEPSNGKLERVLSELEKMAELVRRPSKKHKSDQQASIDVSTERVALKSISFRSINHRLLREMVQRTNPDFFVPVHTTMRPHIKHPADKYRQLQNIKRKALIP